MKKFKKLMCLFLSVLMILSMGIPAFAIDKATDSTSTNETQKTATTTEKNPLTIEISTNKAEYKVTNVAEITATVTNTGKEDIKNVSAEAVFNDLAPVGKKTSETKKEVETLKAGESISFTYKATLNASEHKLNLFQKIFLWFVRLFNGGYTPSDNGFDNGRDCIEQTNTMSFGKFEAVNTVRVWYGESSSNNNEDLTQMHEVDKQINTLMNSAEYKNLNNDKLKAEAIINELKLLEKEGLIQKNSIKYYEESKQIGFKYISGVSGGVYLSKPSKLYAGNNVAYNTTLSTSSIDKTMIKNIQEPLLYNSNKMNNSGYGIVMYGWDNPTDDDSDYNAWDDLAKDISKRGLTTTIWSGATVSDYKTALLDMNFICIAEHGCFDDETSTYTFVVHGDSATFEKDEEYETDIDSEFILKRTMGDGSLRYLITPKFFSRYYRNNKLNDTVVFLSSCMGFGQHGDVDYRFARAFYNDCGADTIIGFHNSVFLAYARIIIDKFSSCMLSGYTAEESLNLAIQLYGATDVQFGYKYLSNSDEWNTPIPEHDGKTGKEIYDEKRANNEEAYPIIYGSADKKWNIQSGYISGTVKDNLTKHPIEDAYIEFTAKDTSATFSATTNENGFFETNLPYANYEVCLSKDSYTDYTMSIEIESEHLNLTVPIYMTRKTGETLCSVSDKTSNNAIENVKIEAIDISSKPLISSYEEFKKHEIVATATTDSKGLASLDLPYGSYLLAFTHDNYEYFMKEVEINAELDISAYDVKLTPKGSSGEDDRTVTASGDCGKNGDNVKWVLYDDGELVISGQGRMADYSGNDNPWNKHKESITSITIEDGVTYIGNASFYNSINLESISFPASLLQIGADAFNSCISLKQLVLPNRLTSIGAYAFYKCEELVEAYLPSALVSLGGNAFGYCKKMKDIVIPEGLCSIGEGAFWHCESITKFSIPSSVELIGQGAFGGCYTCSAFAVSKSNKKYSCYESVLFDKEKKVLINYPIGNTSETYIIPDTVEIVQSYAFGGHPTNGHLSSIEFGANLKCFESNVFEWGGSAQNKIHDVYYKGTLSQWCEIDFESRESNPCYNGSNGSFLHIQDEELTELKIPSSITNIKPFTFCGINNIQKIKFHNNVTNIGDGAFESCHSLKEVKIPDSTVYIASEAFSECPALEYVSLPKNITVDNLAFSGGYDNSELTIVLDGGICTFKGQAFWNHSIAHVHYNGTMQDWCSSHFSSYYSSPAWFGSDFTVDGQTIKANYSNDISIIIPDGVEKINDYAFSGRYINPENFYIPKSIKYIGEHIFDNRVGAVIYQGSEEEWNAVTIEPDNANLNKAAIQFLNN